MVRRRGHRLAIAGPLRTWLDCLLAAASNEHLANVEEMGFRKAIEACRPDDVRVDPELDSVVQNRHALLVHHFEDVENSWIQSGWPEGCWNVEFWPVCVLWSEVSMLVGNTHLTLDPCA